jgi:hypothetical protein
MNRTPARDGFAGRSVRARPAAVSLADALSTLRVTHTGLAAVDAPQPRQWEDIRSKDMAVPPARRVGDGHQPLSDSSSTNTSSHDGGSARHRQWSIDRFTLKQVWPREPVPGVTPRSAWPRGTSPSGRDRHQRAGPDCESRMDPHMNGIGRTRRCSGGVGPDERLGRGAPSDARSGTADDPAQPSDGDHVRPSATIRPPDQACDHTSPRNGFRSPPSIAG